MKYFQQSGIGILAVLLSACASTPTSLGQNSAVAANIRAHSLATGHLPNSTARMTLAVRRYNENDTEPPVEMHTTSDVSKK